MEKKLKALLDGLGYEFDLNTKCASSLRELGLSLREKATGRVCRDPEHNWDSFNGPIKTDALSVYNGTSSVLALSQILKDKRDRYSLTECIGAMYLCRLEDTYRRGLVSAVPLTDTLVMEAFDEGYKTGTRGVTKCAEDLTKRYPNAYFWVAYHQGSLEAGGTVAPKYMSKSLASVDGVILVHIWEGAEKRIKQIEGNS